MRYAVIPRADPNHSVTPVPVTYPPGRALARSNLKPSPPLAEAVDTAKVATATATTATRLVTINLTTTVFHGSPRATACGWRFSARHRTACARPRSLRTPLLREMIKRRDHHRRSDVRTLDHIGFTVADYPRSKDFYEKALAPLGMSLLMEFSGAAAGFGKDDGERPSFFIEAHGEPVHGRLHIALGAESRAQVNAFHAAAIEAGGIDNGAPGLRWYHADYYGGYVLDPDGNNIEAVCHQPE
jgi:catechol 2,3-dioxygenase-like lactoylglutathione lyase family enzyme